MHVEAVAEVWSPASEAGWHTGSGYLIAGRLLLTAAHAVPTDGAQIRLLEEEALWEARVLWRGDGLLDAALLEITDPDFEPTAHRPTRFGRIVSSAPGTYCEAVGFPDATRVFEGPEVVRDSEHLTARLNPLARRKQHLLDLRLDNWPDHAPENPSRWSGMSGAGVWCGTLLVGLVAWDTPGFGQRRLSAVPLSALAEQPGFRHLVERHADRPLRLEPVELQDLLSPCFPAQGPASPAALLRAEHEVVPFSGREGTLHRLTDWCHLPGPLSAWLVTGPGGQGKSRLARRLNELMSEEGWVTGQVAELANVAPHLPTLSRCTAPVLLVLDYAETRPHLVQEIIDHLAAHPPGHPVRVLLLARAAGEWFTALRSASPAMPGTLRPSPLALPPLTDTSAAQDLAWQEALDAFRKRLSGLGGITGTGAGTEQPPVERAAPQPGAGGQALSLHMAALASLLPHGPEEFPEQVLLTHERRYWDRIAERRNLGLGHIRPTAMIAAQLCGPLSRAAALDMLGRVPGLRGDGAEQQRRAVAEWIRDLYPPTASGDAYWGTLEPDPLAEHYLIDALDREPETAAEVLVAAADEQRRHGVTLMARAAARPGGQAVAGHLHRLITEHPRALGGIAVEVAPRVESATVLVRALEALIKASPHSPEHLAELYDRFPADTHVLAEVAAELTASVVSAHRANGDEEELAMCLSDYSIRLGLLGRRAESLTATDEALEILRRLAGERPEEIQPRLAHVLANHSNSLSRVGRRKESLHAAAEAVALLYHLAQSRQRFVWPLASALVNQASALNELGQSEAALRTSSGAVDLFRRLAAANPDEVEFGIGLALALDNQSRGLGALGRRKESLAAISEATEVCRKFAEEYPDAFLPKLAAFLSNQSTRLSELGYLREALAAITESVHIRRRLAEDLPDAFEPDLAASLANQATVLTRNGKGEDALAVSCEAVDIYRKLADQAPESFLDEFALALTAKSTVLDSLHRPAAALAANTEAVQMYERLAAAHTDVFLPSLAGCLNNQSNRLHSLGQTEQALDAAGRSVEIYRQLSHSHPEAHLRDLARSLTNQAAVMAELTESAEAALEPIEEAVDILQRLVDRHGDAFLPDLANALGNLSVLLLQAGQPEEAVATSADAVEILTDLAHARPEVFSSDLARVRDNHAAAVDAVSAVDAFLAVEDDDEADTTDTDREPATPEVHWTPLRQECGCVIDWGWDPASVPPDTFLYWCGHVVDLRCPWHGGAEGKPLGIPDGVPVALRDPDTGVALYARRATGEDVALGRRLADGLQDLTAKMATPDPSAVLAEIPPPYLRFLRSEGYDPVNAWLQQRLVDIVLNRSP
ncbi:hypothetical protein [Streptomyces sp. CA2R101]|uniref:hypothetical protein n=1 Tax=Streptomyces sp. CA2R101 TaxID=3120152 RepID=UPI00300BEC53